MPSQLVLWRETTVFGEHSDVENPVLAYVLCGQRHLLKNPDLERGVMVARAATGKLALLKGATIERVVENGVTKLRALVPEEMLKVLRGAWQHGSEQAMRARMADAAKPTPTIPELKELTEKGGLAAQREVLAKWRKES